MSDLTAKEKLDLENLFNMSSGFVLTLGDKLFGRLFAENNIDIHSKKYQKKGSSKAKKLRAFWEIESNVTVATLTSLLIDKCEKNDEISKKLIQRGREIVARLNPSGIKLEELEKTFASFDYQHISTTIHRMEESVDNDPALAIGTAKELIESCCKTILLERGKQVDEQIEMPALTKSVFKELKLIPDEIPTQAKGSEIIKRLLSNLNTIGNDLAKLRNLYGTGHGKHGATKGLTARHAKLAVGSSATIVIFLYETHKETMGALAIRKTIV